MTLKKHRDESGCFVAEGPKAVRDLLSLLPCRKLYATPVFLSSIPAAQRAGIRDIVEINDAELERLSLLQAPRGCLALFDKPTPSSDPSAWNVCVREGLCLALDTVQDPGNLGTIVRLADWFGIGHIFASADTADVFSPKVVQATMGAVGRVSVHYVDLPSWLAQLPDDIPVYGTFLDGDDLYAHPLTPHGLVVMGNEGKGISDAVAQYVTDRLFISPYPPGHPTGESLNVAIATAITCAEFRRRMGTAKA